MSAIRLQCPFPDCDFETASSEETSVLVALLNIHGKIHNNPIPGAATNNVKLEKLKRLTISLAGTGEAWDYFLTRWTQYRTGTKLSEDDMIPQLLECCEEELRKDLTRAKGAL